MAAGAAFCHRPAAAAGRANVDGAGITPTSPSLGLRPSQSRVFFFISSSSSSRWWMRKKRGDGRVSVSKARAMPMVRRAVFSPVAMEWQECSTEIEVDVPCSVAYQCYSERETIPQWMPFISSVKVLEDKPDLSRWSLKYEILGRDVEFSWLARNMTPTKNQKIHWRSLEGLPNRGAVRFFPKSSSSCRVQLTVAYEVPEILAPVASALKPFLEGLLMNGLERFAAYAKERHSKIPQP
uniref:Coenzyme Q-binding protein COQ10 START domain-containing protein n=1 Tax=Leersia perrieri TaxID=77586 RepID=A0A0D9V0C8_9ORYZ